MSRNLNPVTGIPVPSDKIPVTGFYTNRIFDYDDLSFAVQGYGCDQLRWSQIPFSFAHANENNLKFIFLLVRTEAMSLLKHLSALENTGFVRI